jgi:Right handed beta helix region/PKD domain
MKTSTFAFVFALTIAAGAAAEGATIRVPSDAATIQQAIYAAAPGDTVLVAPGTYFENLNFLGKAITVVSEGGPAVTVIDGNWAGSVVAFVNGESRGAVLRGFTIQHGANSSTAGGVFIKNSSPTIADNWIVDNGGCSGAGVRSDFGSPLIQGNRIARNFVYGCTGGFGLGVYIGGDSAAELIGNTITDNNGPAHGGGVTLFAAGRAVLRSNVIARNVTSGFSPCTQGGGIWMVNFSQATIVNNLVVGNVAGCGGGIYWSGSTGVTTFVNNTFADNDAPQGSAIEFSGADTRHLIFNNILIGKPGQPAVHCSNSSSTPSPVINTSDVFSPQSLPFSGTCADQTGVNGNISADPVFFRAPRGDVPGDYHLQQSSPAVDAGDNAAPQIPKLDLDGAVRIFDGDFDGNARVDLGAYEYFNAPPAAAAGPDQTVVADAGCAALVALDGTGSSDPDGDPLTYSWTGSFGTVSGATASVSLPAGTEVVTLTVRDGRGAWATDTLVVTVLDKTPPVIQSAAASPSVLSPANKQLVPVTIAVSATDACGGSVRCRIVSVTSNEAIDATDWRITGDLTVNLRADRSKKGTGRTYTITIECVDASGNVSTKTVMVTVPR